VLMAAALVLVRASPVPLAPRTTAAS
jgi:hypothetical protein